MKKGNSKQMQMVKDPEEGQEEAEEGQDQHTQRTLFRNQT